MLYSHRVVEAFAFGANDGEKEEKGKQKRNSKMLFKPLWQTTTFEVRP